MSRPDDVLYTRTHEWVRIEGDLATIGITDHAVHELSDLAFVDLPEEGDSVEADSTFGEVESTKTVAELNSPVTGEVVEVNSEVVDNLQLLSDSPFERGWLIRVRCEEAPATDDLLDAEAYQSFIDGEGNDDD